MLKSLKSKLMVLAAAASLVLPLGVPALVSAQDANLQTNVAAGNCSGSNLDIVGNTNTGCSNATAGASLNTLIKNIINVFSIVVGLVAVVMIIIGGFRYIVSGGESSSVSGAKNAILFAIVGLIIVVIAQLIVHFVISRAANTA